MSQSARKYEGKTLRHDVAKYRKRVGGKLCDTMSQSAGKYEGKLYDMMSQSNRNVMGGGR